MSRKLSLIEQLRKAEAMLVLRVPTFDLGLAPVKDNNVFVAGALEVWGDDESPLDEPHKLPKALRDLNDLDVVALVRRDERDRFCAEDAYDPSNITGDDQGHPCFVFALVKDGNLSSNVVILKGAGDKAAPLVGLSKPPEGVAEQLELWEVQRPVVGGKSCYALTTLEAIRFGD